MPTPNPTRETAALSDTPIVDPADLPLDTPTEDDGDDRTNDVPAENEKP